MTLLLRIELYKLRTTRLPYGLGAAAFGLSAALSLLETSRAARGLTVGSLPRRRGCRR